MANPAALYKSAACPGCRVTPASFIRDLKALNRWLPSTSCKPSRTRTAVASTSAEYWVDIIRMIRPNHGHTARGPPTESAFRSQPKVNRDRPGQPVSPESGEIDQHTERWNSDHPVAAEPQHHPRTGVGFPTTNAGKASLGHSLPWAPPQAQMQHWPPEARLQARGKARTEMGSPQRDSQNSPQLKGAWNN